MSKIKVMHVLNSNSYSGAENVAITLIDGIRAAGVDADVIYVSLEGPIRDVLKEHNIAFEPIEKNSIKEIRRVVKKYKPDIIHAHDFTASLYCAFAAFGVPVISHIHNNSPWIRKIGAKTISYGVSCFRYKKMLGVSGSVFDEFVFGKYFKKKQQIIGNPIDTGKIVRMAENADDKSSYDVVFLGRLTEPKRPLMFVDIIERICKSYGPIKAVMIGDGDLRPEVEDAISQKKLDGVITLAGFKENPYGTLSNSKILCLPSAWEGYGLVAAEALSLGKPVVASRVGGIPDIIHGDEGVFCSEVSDFADAISKMLSNADEYTMRSEAAFKRAHEIDNMSKYVGTISDIYREIV